MQEHSAFYGDRKSSYIPPRQNSIKRRQLVSLYEDDLFDDGGAGAIGNFGCEGKGHMDFVNDSMGYEGGKVGYEGGYEGGYGTAYSSNGNSRRVFPKDEVMDGKPLTRPDCKCADCEKALAPSLRPDFENIRWLFASEKLLREASAFAGTQKIRDKIVDHFHTTWAHPLHMGVPENVRVSFMRVDSQVCDRFDEYVGELALICDDPRVRPLWHGTTTQCRIIDGQMSCTMHDGACASCSILTKGFDLRMSGTANPFKRFGAGIYFAPNSSKAHSYATPREVDGSYTVLFCFVTLGNSFITTEDMTFLVKPPYPFHSVHGRRATTKPATWPPDANDADAASRAKLNYDEFVVYRADSIVPFAAVTYTMRMIS